MVGNISDKLATQVLTSAGQQCHRWASIVKVVGGQPNVDISDDVVLGDLQGSGPWQTSSLARSLVVLALVDVE